MGSEAPLHSRNTSKQQALERHGFFAVAQWQIAARCLQLTNVSMRAWTMKFHLGFPHDQALRHREYTEATDS